MMTRRMMLVTGLSGAFFVSCSIWPWGGGERERAGATGVPAEKVEGGGWHFDLFGIGRADREGAGERDAGRDRRVRGLEMGVRMDPSEVRVGETRRVGVLISLKNRSGKMVNLLFPTSQRLEMVWRDETGGVVTRWSEDRSFSGEPGHLVVNPGERIEYAESISTRDLRVGRAYRLEVAIQSHPDLRRSIEVRPRG